MFSSKLAKIRFLATRITLDAIGRKSDRLSNIYIYPLVLTSLLVTGLLSGIRHFGGLQSLELNAYDMMVRTLPEAESDSRILIVEITESDIRNYQRWPISDLTIAQLLQKIQKYQPKAIGLDLYRDIPQLPGQELLQKQLQADNVVVISKLGGENNVPPPPNIPEERIGFNDFVVDSDNVVRRNLIYAQLDSQEFYSFALRLSLQYFASCTQQQCLKNNRQQLFQANADTLHIGDTIFYPLQTNSGGYQMAESEALGWQILTKYNSQQVAPKVTLTDILTGKIDPSIVKDKIVLIGTTAPSIRDLFATPYTNSSVRENYLFPGVIIHAQMVNQILDTVLDDQPLFWFWTKWQEILWIWIWSIIGTILVWRLHHPLHIGIAIICSTSVLWGVSFGLFAINGWIPFVPPVLSFTIASVSVLAYKILYTTYHDTLTGLPNRKLLNKKLKQFLLSKGENEQNPLVILCLDLDRFRLINDGLGYSTGDRLLVTTAQNLQAILNPKDFLARVGGDEFAILLNSIATEKEAIAIAEQLQQKLTLPFHLQDREAFTTVSIGIAINQVDRHFIPENLLLDAYTAMYKAKASGKIHHEVLTAQMHDRALKQLQLEVDLRSAIDNQEFILHYQPIISLKTGKIAGFEALVRWQSPTRGMVSPGDFIPLAEKTGSIVPLGEWVLQEACQQMFVWQQQFHFSPALMISVNLSGRQFSQLDLVDRVTKIVRQARLEPYSLKLEITESMVMDDVEKAISLLEQLKALGIQLSIDDFGTGFSSFNYIHRFPIDALKVDRSFVNVINNSKKNFEIVSTIIMLAHNLGLDVIAEGIETEAQMKILQTLECEYGQGYYFSKPLACEAAEELLKQAPQWC